MSMEQFAGQTAAVVFAIAMLFAGLTDLVSMKIRNFVVLLLLFAWLALAPLSGASATQMAADALVACLVLAGGFLCFAKGWIGGGDAKLAAAGVLWLGAASALDFLVVTGVFGGLFTLALIFFRTAPLPARIAAIDWIERLHAPRGDIPYGVAIAAAAITLMPQARWMSFHV